MTFHWLYMKSHHPCVQSFLYNEKCWGLQQIPTLWHSSPAKCKACHISSAWAISLCLWSPAIRWAHNDIKKRDRDKERETFNLVPPMYLWQCWQLGDWFPWQSRWHIPAVWFLITHRRLLQYPWFVQLHGSICYLSLSESAPIWKPCKIGFLF